MMDYKKIKIKGTILLVFICLQNIYAQQDAQYTQYMYNMTNFNPGYCGTRKVLSIYSTYRSQWVGLDGAPKTTNVSIESPIGLSGLAGGVNYTNDQIGVSSQHSFSLNISYAIDLNKDYKLSFGLKTTGNLVSVDYSKLNVYNPSDPLFGKKVSNNFTPNLGAGLFLYSDQSYLGFSLPNIFNTHKATNDGNALMREKMHLYVNAGHVFELNPVLKLKPSILTKVVQSAPIQVDLTSNFLLYDKLTLGINYRWNASVGALVGFQVNQNLFIGYSLEGDTTQLSRYNSGSHEIFLRFDVFNKYTRSVAPRFF